MTTFIHISYDNIEGILDFLHGDKSSLLGRRKWSQPYKSESSTSEPEKGKPKTNGIVKSKADLRRSLSKFSRVSNTPLLVKSHISPWQLGCHQGCEACRSLRARFKDNLECPCPRLPLRLEFHFHRGIRPASKRCHWPSQTSRKVSFPLSVYPFQLWHVTKGRRQTAVIQDFVHRR